MTFRERNLLLVVVAIILGALWWFLLFNPLQNNIAVEEAEINTLNTQLSELTLEYVKKDQYLEEIKEMTDTIDIIEEEYPSYITQEMMIKTMMDIEEAIESMDIVSYGMSFPAPVVSNGESVDENGVVQYQETLLNTNTQLDLNMTYSDMKKLFAYIRSYDNKLSMDNVIVSSNLEDDTVSTSFTLNFYALMSEDRPFIPEDYFGPFEPKEDSIFNPFDDFGEAFESGEEDALVTYEEDDFILNLSSVYADRSTVIMYKSNNDSGDSYLYTDTEEMIEFEIVFEQNGDNYTYKYRTGDSQYPADYGTGIVYEPGTVIDFSVYSTLRVDDSDLSGVNASIINNTDLTVDLAIFSDDPDLPRFNIVTQSGDVVVSRTSY